MKDNKKHYRKLISMGGHPEGYLHLRGGGLAIKKGQAKGVMNCK